MQTAAQHRYFALQTRERELTQLLIARWSELRQLCLESDRKSLERDEIEHELEMLDDALSARGLERIVGEADARDIPKTWHTLTQMRANQHLRLQTVCAVIRRIEHTIKNVQRKHDLLCRNQDLIDDQVGAMRDSISEEQICSWQDRYEYEHGEAYHRPR